MRIIEFNNIEDFNRYFDRNPKEGFIVKNIKIAANNGESKIYAIMW